jgi:hypothetical protein
MPAKRATSIPDRKPGLKISLYQQAQNGSSSVEMKKVHHAVRDVEETTLNPRWGTSFYLFLPSPQHILQNYIDELGITHGTNAAKVYTDLSDALEWVEDHTLKTSGVTDDANSIMNLQEFEVFEGMQETTLHALERCAQKRFYAASEMIFTAGTPGDALMLISRGLVRVDLPLSEGRKTHLATFGRGQFVGEMTFLDHIPHSADVQAITDTEVFVIHRSDFDELAKHDYVMSNHVFASLASFFINKISLT